jgi:hypothetical protein
MPRTVTRALSTVARARSTVARARPTVSGESKTNLDLNDRRDEHCSFLHSSVLGTPQLVPVRQLLLVKFKPPILINNTAV